MNNRTTDSLLFVAGALTVIGVSIPILRNIFDPTLRLAIGAMLSAFFITFIVCIFFFNDKWATRIYLAINTLLIVLIVSINLGNGHGSDSVYTLFFILSSCAALLLSPREGVLWIVGFILVQCGLIINANGWIALLGWSSFIGGHFMFASFGYLVREANNARQQMQSLYGELQQTHTQLQEYATKAEKLAVAEERNRLAREMHDSLGHRLTVAVLQLEGAQRLIPSEPNRAAEMVGAMRTQLKESLGELRNTLSSLRAPEAEEKSATDQLAHTATMPNAAENGAASSSLRADLNEMVQTFCGATGLAVDLKIGSNLPPFSPPQRLGIYRAAQELLTNVHRHAEATNAWVDVTFLTDSGAGKLLLEVADDGRGMPPEIGDARFGLQGLRERATQLGGTFESTAREAGGTIARFEIPTEEGAMDAELFWTNIEAEA